MCSAAGYGDAAVWVFSTSGFHRLVANEAYQFRNQQSRTLVKLATMVLSGTRGPWLFLVIREGLGSGVRLGARSTQRLTYQLRLALEPERLDENPMATAKEDSRMGRIRSKTLKLFVVSDIGRRSLLLSSIRSVRWWQSFLPRSVVPSPVACLWPLKPRRTPERDLAC